MALFGATTMRKTNLCLVILSVILTLWTPQCQGYGLSHMSAHGHDGKHTHAHKDKGEAQAAAVPDNPEDSPPERPVGFDEAFGKLFEFYKANKHSKVPQSTSVTLQDGITFKLGKWVQRQRQLYKNTYVTPNQRVGFGQMSDSERGKLATVEFLFDPTPLPKAMEWDDAFEAVKKYKEQHGTADLPEKTFFNYDGDLKADLGKWSQRQRQLYKNTFVTPGARKGFGQMTEERRDKLKSIGFNFDK